MAVAEALAGARVHPPINGVDGKTNGVACLVLEIGINI